MNEKSKIDLAVAKLIGQPLEPGTLIKAEVFEELLEIKRDQQAFSWLISHIRRALYDHGLYLSGEGFAQTGAYEIFHQRDNYWVARMALERAERDIEGKQSLLVNTRLDGLSDLEKRRHESMLREVSMKIDAMRRAAEVASILKKRKKQPPPEDEQLSIAEA